MTLTRVYSSVFLFVPMY